MAYDDTHPRAARASRRGRVVNYAGLFGLALVALRKKMAKHPDGLRFPDGDRSGDLCCSERQGETGPGCARA